MNTLREAAQKVIDERYKPDGEWDDLKNAISDLADVLDRKPIHSPSNNGGPAFPHWNCAENTTGGMTLRDYFAAAALQGMLANPDFNGASDAAVAGFAFRQADAMLAARERKEDA